MRQCIDVILTRIFSVIDIKAGMPQTILRKHNIQRAQYLYNDSIGIELQVLERNNASRKRDIVMSSVFSKFFIFYEIFLFQRIFAEIGACEARESRLPGGGTRG